MDGYKPQLAGVSDEFPFAPSAPSAPSAQSPQGAHGAQSPRSPDGSPALPGGYRECAFEAALAGIYPVYQPIVSASGKSTLGYEALLRTEHERFTNPGQLIDLALHLGRMQDLGSAIRARVARDVALAPSSASIFVNLHCSELTAPDLLDGPLTAHAERVVLEITERASLDCVEDPRQTLDGLRARGYRIAIDDLGAGYSGLSTVAELEPHVCKLDMSVSRNVHESRAKQRLVRAVTQMCQELEMVLVTEGVETLEERDCLVSLGCDVFQGWLYGRPHRAFITPTWT